MFRIRHESNNKTPNFYTALFYQNVLVLATKTKSANVSYLGNLINISWTGNNLKSDIPARLSLWRKKIIKRIKMSYVKYLRLPKLAYLYVYVIGTLKVISWEPVWLQTELDSTQSYYLY